MENQRRGRRGRPQGTSLVFYQQALAEAMGATAAAITQASAAGNEGESGDLQGFQVYHPPTCMGGGDSMVRIDLAIEREVDEI